MILECDIGNTRTKWRLLDGRLSVDSGSLNTVDCGFHGLPVNPVIERVRVACVAGSELELKLQGWVSENLGLSCEFARTGAQAAGVTNCYEHPGKMGVDRWLAALAAYSEYRSAVLVIDLGSALTAEVVDDNGCHIGGYIIPGAGLMRQALLTGTEQVRFDDELPVSLALGRSTAEAVSYGISVAVVGTVKQIIEQAGQSLPEGFNIVLTGGGAQGVRPYLADTLDWRPDLVLDGLRFLLP
jgi:type III pantothenate kinase